MTILMPDNEGPMELEVGPVALFEITRNNLERREDKLHCSKCLNEITEESFYRGAAKGLPVMMFHSGCVKEYL